MQTAKRITMALSFVAVFPTHALPADLCKAIALRDVAAVEAPDTVLPRRAYDRAITQYVVEKGTGLTKFFSHGGYCFPTHVQINGKKIEALRLVNCRVGTRKDQDRTEIIYYLDVIREKNSPEALRIDDLDNKFLEMGLGNAPASNVAMFYVKRPNSQCAQVARQALEGNPVATDQLRGFPDFCNWR
jgi:hypothetical protein